MRHVSADGKRCGARGFLELDHIVPHALGGSDEAENLRVRCRPHNRLYAEQVFGSERVAMEIARTRQHRERRIRADAKQHLVQPRYFASPTSESIEDSKSQRDDASGGPRGREASNAPDVSETALSVVTYVGAITCFVAATSLL